MTPHTPLREVPPHPGARRRRRVLLIDPPLYRHPLWDPIRTSQPLGLWSIGSYLQARGHDVHLLCAPLQGLQRVEWLGRGERTTLDALHAERLGLLDATSTGTLVDRWFDDPSLVRVGVSDAEILSTVASFRPDVVGIAGLASCMHESFVATARLIRRHHPDLPIVVGGQHATAMPRRLLQDADGAIDLVVLGEGELVFSQVVDLLPDLRAARSVKGVAWLGDPASLDAKTNRPGWTDLSVLPPLDPALMAHVPLPRLPAHTFGREPKRCTDMMFSVGCHRACPYCFSPVMRGKLRQVSEDGIVRQLRLLRDAGYDELVLQDDDLLKNKAFFLRLLSSFRASGLSWQDNGGMELELLDDELVDAIIASGCTSIYVPVNPRQLAERLPTAQAVANVHYMKRLRDAGVYTFTSGIYGVPNLERAGETYDDMLRLRDFHVRLVAEGYVDASLVFPLSALPGTPWFRAAARDPNFLFDRDRWIGYSIFVPQVYPRELGARRLWREIVETHRTLNALQTSLPWFSPFPNRLAPAPDAAVPAGAEPARKAGSPNRLAPAPTAAAATADRGGAAALRAAS